MRMATVSIIGAANEEVSPLRNVTGSCDAAGVGTKIVRMAERRIVRDTGQNYEPDKQLGDAEKYESDGG
jgi:hypothetical protein